MRYVFWGTCLNIFFHSKEDIMAVKYVFVTGGVVSGLGKGITAASLGRLLKARGYTVTMQKSIFRMLPD